MWTHFSALPLIFTYAGFVKNKQIIRKEITIENDIRAYHFYPKDQNPKNLPGVYIQHGMSVLGIDDQRIIDLSENLAYCGISVILPELSEVKALRFQKNTVSRIEGIMHYLHKNHFWYNGHSLGFLSASFSGGMGLISLSKPNTNHLAKVIMVIGAYSDFLDTLPFVFSNYNRDNYGVYVLLYNFIENIRPKLAKELKPVFFEAAVDNALHRLGEDRLTLKLLPKISNQARKFFYEVENDESFRDQIGQEILSNVGDLPISLSPFHQLEKINCPVILLHGEDDPVISPAESKKLTEVLAKKDIPFLYRTSSSITHGDNLPLHSQIFGVPALLETFGSFIQHLKT